MSRLLQVGERLPVGDEGSTGSPRWCCRWWGSRRRTAHRRRAVYQTFERELRAGAQAVLAAMLDATAPLARPARPWLRLPWAVRSSARGAQAQPPARRRTTDHHDHATRAWLQPPDLSTPCLPPRRSGWLRERASPINATCWKAILARLPQCMKSQTSRGGENCLGVQRRIKDLKHVLLEPSEHVGIGNAQAITLRCSVHPGKRDDNVFEERLLLGHRVAPASPTYIGPDRFEAALVGSEPTLPLPEGGAHPASYGGSGAGSRTSPAGLWGRETGEARVVSRLVTGAPRSSTMERGGGLAHWQPNLLGLGAPRVRSSGSANDRDQVVSRLVAGARRTSTTDGRSQDGRCATARKSTSNKKIFFFFLKRRIASPSPPAPCRWPRAPGRSSKRPAAWRRTSSARYRAPRAS